MVIDLQENATFDVNSVLGLLHHVVVGSVVDVSEVHSASIFRVEVCRLVSYYVYVSLYHSIMKRKGEKGDRVGIGARLSHYKHWTRKVVQTVLLRAQECVRNLIGS
jgi:hypothetical protein